MIIFDEDEKFETISLGDTESWQVVPAEKGNILFVKPIAKDVTTNMNVVTDKRIYYLELHDFAPDAGRKVFGIRFHYPEKNLNAALAHRRPSSAPPGRTSPASTRQTSISTTRSRAMRG